MAQINSASTFFFWTATCLAILSSIWQFRQGSLRLSEIVQVWGIQLYGDMKPIEHGVDQSRILLGSLDHIGLITNDSKPKGIAGLGVELETPDIHISSVGDCPYLELRAAKGRVVNNTRGRNWKLTADIQADGLSLEYIIDGTTVEVGSMEAYTVAGEIERHLIEWNITEGDEITIEENKCKWVVESIYREKRHLRFTPQITAALPLSVIYDILRGAEFGTPNPHWLDHFERRGQERVIVTPEFFQSHPSGLGPSELTGDLLGFLSIMLSWSKGTMNFDDTMLFKGLTWIMPRTDFVGLYNQVDSHLQGIDLYQLFKTLACYRNDYSGPQVTRNRIVLDDRYCTGSLATPIPLDTMDTLSFKIFRNESVLDSLLVSDWIKGVQNKQSPDGLSALGAKYIYPSIGGKGLGLANMYGSSQRVPLFEFRDLKPIKPREFQRLVAEAEEGIMRFVQSSQSFVDRPV